MAGSVRVVSTVVEDQKLSGSVDMLPVQVEIPDEASAGTEQIPGGNDRENYKGKNNKKGNCNGKSNRRSFDSAPLRSG
jgi:hypothetical protein